MWDTVNGSPCPAPILSPPNIANPACDGTLSYGQVGRPRNFMPTERFRFQSSYFKNFETSGSIGYSNSDNTINDFDEIATAGPGRTISRGSTTKGPAEAKRVSVNARLVRSLCCNRQAPDIGRIQVRQLAHPRYVGLQRDSSIHNRRGLVSPITPIPGTCITNPANCPNHNSRFGARYRRRHLVHVPGAKPEIQHVSGKV